MSIPTPPPPPNPANPYSPPTSTPAPGQFIPPKPGEIRIAPFQRLKRAKELMGDQYMLFVGICFVGALIAGSIPVVFVGAMFCGMFYCFRQKMAGQQTSFDMLFKGFDRFGDGIIVALIHFGIAMLILIPVYVVMLVVMIGSFAMAEASGASEMGPIMFLITYPFLLLFISIAMGASMVPFTFAFPLVMDQGLTGSQACSQSWRAAKPYFFKLMGLHVTYMIIGMLAALCCYVPAFFFYPLAIGATYTLYQDMFGLQFRDQPK